MKASIIITGLSVLANTTSAAPQLFLPRRPLSSALPQATPGIALPTSTPHSSTRHAVEVAPINSTHIISVSDKRDGGPAPPKANVTSGDFPILPAQVCVGSCVGSFLRSEHKGHQLVSTCIKRCKRVEERSESQAPDNTTSPADLSSSEGFLNRTLCDMLLKKLNDSPKDFKDKLIHAIEGSAFEAEYKSAAKAWVDEISGHNPLYFDTVIRELRGAKYFNDRAAHVILAAAEGAKIKMDRLDLDQEDSDLEKQLAKKEPRAYFVYKFIRFLHAMEHIIQEKKKADELVPRQVDSDTDELIQMLNSRPKDVKLNAADCEGSCKTIMQDLAVKDVEACIETCKNPYPWSPYLV